VATPVLLSRNYKLILAKLDILELATIEARLYLQFKSHRGFVATSNIDDFSATTPGGDLGIGH
jgi:hypothetical protein